MKRRKVSLTGILYPYSMEERHVFLARFDRNAEMRYLFPAMSQRAEIAESAFAEKWKEALVTVTRADGVQFFID